MTSFICWERFQCVRCVKIRFVPSDLTEERRNGGEGGRELILPDCGSVPRAAAASSLALSPLSPRPGLRCRWRRSPGRAPRTPRCPTRCPLQSGATARGAQRLLPPHGLKIKAVHCWCVSSPFSREEGAQPGVLLPAPGRGTPGAAGLREQRGASFLAPSVLPGTERPSWS